MCVISLGLLFLCVFMCVSGVARCQKVGGGGGGGGVGGTQTRDLCTFGKKNPI